MPVLRQATCRSYKSVVVFSKILNFLPQKSDIILLGKPDLKLKIELDTSLRDLVGPRSFAFWQILQLGYSWLEKHPSQWDEDADYRQAKAYIRTVKVTNNLAERGVKLIADYASILTTSDELLVKLMHGVELHKKQYRDFKKNTLNQ